MKVSINSRSFDVENSDAPGIPGFWNYVNDGKWEKSTYDIFDLFLEEDKSYIDIGAWIGPTVLYGAQISKHCYAVEPDPVAYGVLLDNLKLNPEISNNVTLFNGCLSDITGEVDFGSNSSFGDSTSSLLFSAKGSIKVRSLCFQDLITNYGINDCNFIKMDIEGGEIILLPTMKEYLAVNKPTLFLSLHSFNLADKEKYATTIIDTLNLFPNVYLPDGTKIDIDKLHNFMLTADASNVSVVATKYKVAKSLMRE